MSKATILYSQFLDVILHSFWLNFCRDSKISNIKMTDNVMKINLPTKLWILSAFQPMLHARHELNHLLYLSLRAMLANLLILKLINGSLQAIINHVNLSINQNGKSFIKRTNIIVAMDVYSPFNNNLGTKLVDV